MESMAHSCALIAVYLFLKFEMDQFTLTRLQRLLETWKARHGRDISNAELSAAGIDSEVLKNAIGRGLVEKYQATNQNGSKENRYRLRKDWRELNR